MVQSPWENYALCFKTCAKNFVYGGCIEIRVAIRGWGIMYIYVTFLKCYGKLRSCLPEGVCGFRPDGIALGNEVEQSAVSMYCVLHKHSYWLPSTRLSVIITRVCWMDVFISKCNVGCLPDSRFTDIDRDILFLHPEMFTNIIQRSVIIAHQ